MSAPLLQISQDNVSSQKKQLLELLSERASAVSLRRVVKTSHLIISFFCSFFRLHHARVLDILSKHLALPPPMHLNEAYLDRFTERLVMVGVEEFARKKEASAQSERVNSTSKKSRDISLKIKVDECSEGEDNAFESEGLSQSTSRPLRSFETLGSTPTATTTSPESSPRSSFSNAKPKKRRRRSMSHENLSSSIGKMVSSLSTSLPTF